MLNNQDVGGIYITKIKRVEVDDKAIVIVEEPEHFVFYLETEDSEPLCYCPKSKATSLCRTDEDGVVTGFVVVIGDREVYETMLSKTSIKLPIIYIENLFYNVLQAGVYNPLEE